MPGIWITFMYRVQDADPTCKPNKTDTQNSRVQHSDLFFFCLKKQNFLPDISQNQKYTPIPKKWKKEPHVI